MSIRTDIRSEYLNLRRKRGDKLSFLAHSTPLPTLSRLLSYEYTDIFSSDALLIETCVLDLQKRKLLHSRAIQSAVYSYGGTNIFDTFLRTIDNSVYCRGTSTSKTESVAKALGEVFERTSIKYAPGKLRIASSQQLTHERVPHIKPSDFAKPTPAQLDTFSYMRTDDTQVFSWVPVRHTATGKNVLAPAQCVFYGNRRVHDSESYIIQPSTHGAGAGFSAEAAYASGLFEITHRHFFFKNWYQGLAPRRIDPATLPTGSGAARLAHSLQTHGFILHLLDYSTEAGVPCSITLIEIYGGLYCGGTSGTSLERCIERGLSEAFATYLWVHKTSHSGGFRIKLAEINALRHNLTDTTTDAYNRVYWYSNSYFLEKVGTQFLSGAHISFSESVKDGTLTRAVQNFPDTYVYHLPQTELLADYSYHVARTIAPQSYIFALAEHHSRPLLSDGIQPVNTLINPFP
jgi:thiazole/oxazole-forming peptide maturase SagD family component